MKNLTEIVKNIKTSGKNLVVYSSMLLTLGGAYTCGGNDNSNNDGGIQSSQDGSYNPLQDAGNGGISSSLLYNCDELCQLRKDCGKNTDIDEKGRCPPICGRGIDTLSSEYVTEINKCFSKYPDTKICNTAGAGEECLDDAYSACVPGCSAKDMKSHPTAYPCFKKLGEIDRLKPLDEVYCKKASECNQLGEKTEAECIESYNLSRNECLSPKGLEDSKACIEGMSCSNWNKIYECELGGYWGTGKEQLLQF